MCWAWASCEIGWCMASGLIGWVGMSLQLSCVCCVAIIANAYHFLPFHCLSHAIAGKGSAGPSCKMNKNNWWWIVVEQCGGFEGDYRKQLAYVTAVFVRSILQLLSHRLLPAKQSLTAMNAEFASRKKTLATQHNSTVPAAIWFFRCPVLNVFFPTYMHVETESYSLQAWMGYICTICKGR